MGYHWQILGYESAQHFESLMNQDEASQLDAFCRFIALPSNKKLLKAMQQKDFATFARLYNGVAYEKNHYDEKLKLAYRLITNEET